MLLERSLLNRGFRWSFYQKIPTGATVANNPQPLKIIQRAPDSALAFVNTDPLEGVQEVWKLLGLATQFLNDSHLQVREHVRI